MPQRPRPHVTPPDAKAIYKVAFGFQLAASHLFPLFPDASIFNAALATELMLKTLIVLEGGTYPPTHNLKELFQLLAPESQLVIRKHAEGPTREWFQRFAKAANESADGFDFDRSLELSANAFDDFRYSFEVGRGPRHWTGQFFNEAVQARIFELRPTWKQWRWKMKLKKIDQLTP